SSVWPFWRPKPLTSVTVTPCTPIALRASRTSSSLNGLTIAVTIFMVALPRKNVEKRPVSCSRHAGRGLQGLADRDDGARLVDVAPDAPLRRADDRARQGKA